MELPEGAVYYYGTSFLNQRILKLLTRTLTSALAAARRASVQRQGVVLVYSVHLPFMLVGSAFARLTKSVLVAVWTDPPAVALAAESALTTNVLRRLELSFSSMLMRRFDLVIAVTADLANDFAPGVPHLVIEAFADPSNERPAPSYKSGGRTIFTYTGSLDRRNGIPNIVEAAQLLPDDADIAIQFFGYGDYADELRRISANSNRVLYMGSVSSTLAQEAQTRSDFLINARPAQEPFTRYSFPSKTLEYMRSGVPVLSTALPGIPSIYFAHMIFMPDNDPGTIARFLVEASHMSSLERMQLGTQARAFTASRAIDSQALRIAQFLQDHAF